jgi:branched-chain amino acid transport system substrate-binding protein
MKIRHLIYILVLFALVLTSCGPKAAAEPDVCASDEFGCAVIPPGETIKLGMGAPMTGDYSMFGIDISNGALIAVADQADVDGFAFELVAEDTQGSPELGAAVANKFVNDPTFVAIPGHIFSGSTEAAMPIYDKAGLPMLSPSATNPPLTTLGSKVFNRVAFTDDVQAGDSSEFMYNELGIRKLAVMHDGGTYGQGLADLVKEDFTALGGEVVAYEAVTVGETDYTAVLSSVASKEPDAIYFGGYVAEAVVIVNQMAQSGLGDAIFFGCDGTFGQEFLQKTGANGEGAYAASLVPPNSPAKDAFDAAYLAAYGEGPGVLSPYTWSGYDATKALMDQVAKLAVLGDDGNLYVPRGALVTAVRTMSGVQGITGVITCSEVGECNAAGPALYIIKDGEWVSVK